MFTGGGASTWRLFQSERTAAELRPAKTRRHHYQRSNSSTVTSTSVTTDTVTVSSTELLLHTVLHSSVPVKEVAKSVLLHIRVLYDAYRYLCKDVVCLAEDPAGVSVRGDQQL